jgi:single-strand DNA-binding protein
MATDNFIQIIGNLTRDPELRYTTGGVAVCSFGIAWTPRRRNANGEWEDGETSFFNCSAWRDLGENIAASVNKGNRVVVTGSVRARDWEDRDGNKRTSIEIDVDECSPSLRWAQAQIQRTERSGGDGGFSGGGGGNAGNAGGGNAGGGRGPDPVYGDEEPF